MVIAILGITCYFLKDAAFAAAIEDGKVVLLLL